MKTSISFNSLKAIVRLASVLCVLLVGVGNVWGGNWNKITNLSDITSGDSVLVVIQDGKTLTVGKAFKVGAGTTNNSEDVTITSNSYISNPANNIKWAMTKSGDNYIFKSSTNKYIGTGSTTNANVSGNESSSYTWYITKLSNGYFKVQLSSSSGRYISWKGSEFGKYANGSFVNQISTSAALAQYHGAISFYKKGAESCTKSVTVSDGGSSSHGSITSITTSPVATCSSTASDRQVSIVVTPSNGYTAPDDLSIGTKTGTVTSTKVSRTDNYNGTFTFVYRYNQNDNGSISYNASCVAKTYTISLNDQDATTAASPSSITATFDSNTGLTGTVVTTLPTKTGYTFGGYYNAVGGSGVQLINSSGEIVASASGGGKTYTDASKNWIHSGGVTVYAKWTEKALTNYRTLCCTELGTPTNLNATPNGTGGTVYWDAVANASGYEVSIDGGANWNSTNTNSYAITGQTCGGNTVNWMVRATGTGEYCETGPSASSSFVTSACACSYYQFHYQHNSDWNMENICFTPVSSGNINYLTDELALPVAEWYNVTGSGAGGHGASDAYTYGFTGTTDNVPMHFFHKTDKSFGANPQVGNLGGGLGRFHVYGNSDAKNKYVSFIPASYTLNFGTGDSWTNDSTLVFSGKTNDWDETEWYTPMTTLSNAAIGRKVFVGLKTANGYVWCDPYSQKDNLTGLRTKTGPDSWLVGGMSTSYAEKTGKFRIYANSGDNNWYVTFVPYFRLTYDANSGTGAPSASDYVCCEGNNAARTIAISATEPTRDGYRFIGWATTAERAAAGTVDYKYGTASNEVVLTRSLTLFAVWKQLYAVTYAYAGGSGSCAGGSYIEGETVTVCATDPTKPGCDFTGWSYSPSVTVTTGTFPMPASNVAITATWTDHNYTLTHSGSNYSYAGNPSTIASGDTPLELTYTCTGSYAFPTDVSISGGGKGSWTKDTHYTWTVGEDLQSATLVITPATTITANVTITITMGTRYTVTYVHNDKGTYSGSSTTQYARPSSSITLPTVTDVDCGFYDTFEGWIASGSEYSESTSKPATVYAGGSSYTVSSDVTLRALYSKCVGDGGSVYREVTAIGDVTNGTYILVSNNSTPHVYSGHTGSNNYGDIVSGLTNDGDDYSSTLPSGAVPVTIAKGTETHTSHFTIKNGTKYFKAGSDIALQDTESWWQLTDGSNVSSKACPAGALQPVSATTYVMQEYSSNRFKTYQNTQSYYVFLYKLIDKCTKYYATDPSCVKPVGVHIVYNANGGEMTCSNQNKTYKVVDAENQYPQLASVQDFCTSATRTGYTLVGWNTQTNGLGTTYNINQHYYNLPVSGELDGENWVTLNVYAMWASAVSFNLGNATGGTGVPAVVEADGGFMLPEPTAAQIGTIPCGYSFYGWSESSVGATTTKPTLFMPGTKYTGASRTLYAVYRLAGEGGGDQYYFTFEVDSKTYCITRKHASYDRFVVEETTTGLEFGLDNGYLYYMEDDARVYVYWAGSGTTVTTTSIMPNNNNYKTSFVAGASGTTVITPAISGRYLQFTGTGMYGDYYDRAYYTTGGTNPTLVEATSYTYATNPSCETTATLEFVTNGGTLNYPDTYDANSYVDLTVGTNVYLPTATYAGEWEFEGWMKGSELPSQDYSPEGMSNFYTVTLNTTTYSAAPAGTTTFYAVYSKTINDKQFDPVNGGTYKLFAIMADGTTKNYMPVWDGSQTTLDEVTSCAATGDYTITPGTGEHEGQYKITHSTHTLGVRSDGDTQFKDVADAWWDIEPSTSGKGTWRIKIHGSTNRCMSYGGTGFFGNYIISNFVDNPSQPGYRDMEIGECIYTEYTSTPENIPYITITGSPVKITSTNGERVYAPTKVHIEAHNFTGTRRINFSATNGFATNPAYVNCEANGSYRGDIDIYYQPTTDGDGSIVTSVLTASQAAESVTQTFSAISGRNMPTNFVIAVKSGSQWYALPDDCHSSGTPKAVPIEVNDPNAPTAASLVPHNVEWRLSDVVNSGDRPKDKVYFYEPNSTNNYTLYAGSAPNIQTNAQLSNVTGENSYTYEWGLSTSDLCAYTISNANVNKNLSINTSGTFGTHATNVVSDILYLLPITAYYTPAEFQVVEWKANSVVVMYLGNAAKASVQVGGNTEGDDQTLSDVKVDHGVYELAATGLTSTSAAFESLQIVFKNAGGTEIGRSYVAIPAIINGEVLTSEYESKKDFAESNDVVILKNGKLTTTGTGTDASSYKFTNVTVYGGGKLDIASGTKLGVTGSLILRAGGVVAGAYDYVYPQLNLAGTLTNSSGNFYYEYVTNYTQWFHLVLPFDARTTSIKYPTEYYGSAVTADNHGSWVIKRYDGATRATGNYDAWVDIESDGEPTPTTVNAGKGYIYWGAPKKVTANGVKDRQTWGIQRITMIKAAETAKTEENADKTINGLSSYSGVSGNSGKNNDQGWNLIGNPYMVNLTGLNSTSIQVGQLVHSNTTPWDGKWVWDNTDPEAGGLRYVTIPDHHFDNYEAKTMSWFTAENPMKTGRTFFVQIAGENTSVLFASSNRASLMPARFAQTAQSVDIETGIVMSDESKHDEVNFWIKEDKTAEYEYNADYPKTPNNMNFNIYGVHSHGDLSWIAISPEIAEGSMAIGYQVPTAGEYRLSMSETYVSDMIDQLLVTDHEMSPEITTNLLTEDYVFQVNQAETNNTRFTVSIRLAPQTPTDIGNLPGEGLNADHAKPQKFIYHDKLYILRNGVIYDATGKQVR